MRLKSNLFSPLTASLTYAVIAGLWILVSGWTVERLFGAQEIALQIERYKGYLFVAVTALVMYFLLRGWRQNTLTHSTPSKTRKRNLFFTLLGLASLVPLLTWLVFSVQKPILEQKVENQMESIVDLKTKQVENWLQERHGDAQNLFKDAHFKHALANLMLAEAGSPSRVELKQTIRSRLANLAELFHYQSVTLLSESNQAVIALGTPHRSKPEIFSSSIREALTQNRVQFVSHYEAAEPSPTLRLYWIIPFQLEMDGKTTTASVVLYSDHPGFLDTLLEPTPVYNFQSDAYLVLRQIRQLVPLFDFENRNAQSTDECFSDRVMKRLLVNQNYHGLIKDCDQTQHYLTSRHIAGTDWLMVKRVKQEVALGELYTLSTWVAVITLFAVLALSFVVWLMWRQQQRLYDFELHTAENRLDHFINASPSILYVLKYDNGQVVTEYVSNNIERLLGYSVNAAMALNWWQNHLHPEDREQAMQDFAKLFEEGELTHEYRIYDVHGQVRYIRDELRTLRSDEGELLEIVGTWNDITREKEQVERLTQAKVVFDATQEGIMVTDRANRILNVNPAFTRLTGYSKEEAIGQTPDFLQSGNHSPAFYRAMWEAIDHNDFWQGEIWNRRKNGDIFPQLMSINKVVDKTGLTSHYIAVFSDISQLKESQEQLDFLSYHDPLTHLPNRTLLMSRIEHQIHTASSEHTRFALLLLDLDYFKDINDSYGHHTGDKVLQSVAQRLKNLLSEADTIARLGGDEFAILLQSDEDPARLAEAITQELKTPFQTHKIEIRLGGSLGISLYPEHGQTSEELLQNADAALYRAKAQGRNSFAYYTQDLTEQARQRIEMEAELKQAADRNELELHYQPQIDLETNRVTGAEALLRWNSQRRGLVSPAEFIPFAEQIGIINELGAWVLTEACRQGRAWLDQGHPPIRLAVNISAQQFQHDDLESQVKTALEETGFPPQLLELEITESALIELDKAVEPLLKRLQSLGISLAIDDFGTGYSSLAYLKRFSVDILKIDKSFIDDLEHDPDDRAIIRAVISMAHTLGLKTLAEGVETQAQKNYLSKQGCDFYQGYLGSRPLKADDFVEWFSRHSTSGQ